MKIDGKSIIGCHRDRINAIFSEAVNWSCEATYDTLINDWIWGPDCFDLLIGGELWIVCDTKHGFYDTDLEADVTCCVYRNHENAVTGENENWICNRELYDVVAALSPTPGVTMCMKCGDVGTGLCEKCKEPYFEIGTKPSLDLHMQYIPACGRSAYVIEWIYGDLYGMRAV